jgi:hypothetical protein
MAPALAPPVPQLVPLNLRFVPAYWLPANRNATLLFSGNPME